MLHKSLKMHILISGYCRIIPKDLLTYFHYVLNYDFWIFFFHCIMIQEIWKSMVVDLLVGICCTLLTDRDLEPWSLMLDNNFKTLMVV